MADQETPRSARAQTIDDLSEDTLGVGSIDIRTIRDLLIRPREVLEAWMTQGPTANGRYTRPLRLYLALNGVLMLIQFLNGGSSNLLTGLPPEVLTPVIEASGKTRDAFLADADGWMSLITVPLLASLYVAAATPLLRGWDRDDLGWRRGLRAACAYLNAWTVPLLPIAWFLYGTGPLAALAALAMAILGLVAFLRMGRGRWYQSMFGGVIKALALATAIAIVGLLGSGLVAAVGLYAGTVA
ncbi:hypothetical protein [Brevundimonas sp.]|uniref:hypothetical protein n=1 Tax=Brevundimonas sp. TaxID=1871086 RepID=UPI002ED7B00A